MSADYLEQSRTQVLTHFLRLKGISVTVEIRVYREDGQFFARTSHDIKTPEQRSPYADTSRRASAEEVLDLAVSGFTQFYGVGIKAGHEPSPSWLVPNDNPWD